MSMLLEWGTLWRMFFSKQAPTGFAGSFGRGVWKISTFQRRQADFGWRASSAYETTGHVFEPHRRLPAFEGILATDRNFLAKTDGRHGPCLIQKLTQRWWLVYGDDAISVLDVEVFGVAEH